MINGLIWVFHLNAVVTRGAPGRVSYNSLCFCGESFVLGYVGLKATVEERP